MGALSLPLAQDLHLSRTDTALMVSLPLLSGALLRVVAGWSSDWYGAKPTGTLILVGELAVVLWGWLGIHSYAELLLIALLLGIGGASFAVTLPLAGRTYPAAHQGLVLGIVASGNVGTVLILFFAPRFAATGGWHDVFGWMTLPIVASLAIFLLLVRDDRQSRRAERDTHWWHNVAVMIRQPKAYWLCGLYAVTFGGFVGFCSILPLFFHEQYHVGGSPPARLRPCMDWWAVLSVRLEATRQTGSAVCERSCSHCPLLLGLSRSSANSPMSASRLC